MQSSTLAWVILIIAGLCETGFASAFWHLFFIATLMCSIVGLKFVS